ncbi:MAG: caspase family protein, partial [Thermoguttaceae bacterium]|nr:caspase family protein [Thermoguttaceae bacterium]
QTKAYFVRVSGYNGADGIYSLNFRNFDEPRLFDVPEVTDFFSQTYADDCVKIVNSVATLDWSVNRAEEAAGVQASKWVDQFVEDTIVEYRKVGSSEWIQVYEAGVGEAASCKIKDLEPNTQYEFRVSASNGGEIKSSVVRAKTDNFMNEVRYHAIIVGVSDYPGGSASDVVAAANDAKAFKEALLQDPQWTEDNIDILIDSEATREAVRAKFLALATGEDKLDDNDVFVFYFAGSGMSRVPFGQRVGYLKTYGSVANQYVSSDDLVAWANQITAGSKLFILDAGQVPEGVEAASIDYNSFISGLTSSLVNGESPRPAETTVLTATASYEISAVSAGRRSDFNMALVDSMTSRSVVVTQETINAAIAATIAAGGTVADVYNSLELSDGRVSFAELSKDIASSFNYVQRGVAPLCYSNVDTESAILMNGFWSETEQARQDWIEAGAIIVTTAVDAVDKHDGKTSLREAVAAAAEMQAHPMENVSKLREGATFTVGVGAQVKIGKYEGELLTEVPVVYSAGAFKTSDKCSIIDRDGRTYDLKAGLVFDVNATEETFADVAKMTDKDGRPVASVINYVYKTVASEYSDNPIFARTSKVQITDVFKTTTDASAKDVTVRYDATTRTYKLYSEGVVYTKNYAYLNGERVTFSTGSEVTTRVALTRIIFDESLAGKPFTVAAQADSIVIDAGVVIDGASLRGELLVDGSEREKVFEIKGDQLVSMVGMKIYNVGREADAAGPGVEGTAIYVAPGAKLELANCAIYDNIGGADGVVVNDGELKVTNVTFAKNTGDCVVKNNGELKITNALFGLNNCANEFVAGGYVLDSTNYVDYEDPGFVNASLNDFRLKGWSKACDRGDNSAAKLECKLYLDFDLGGDKRISYGRIDAGAYEYVADPALLETPSTIVTTLEDIVNLEDGQISLREALFYAGSTTEVQTQLPEGTIVVAQNGFKYEVKNGKFVAFVGASATEDGQFYAVPGAWVVDSLGVATQIPNGSIVDLASGQTAIVVGGQFIRNDGAVVADGEVIRYKTSAVEIVGSTASSAAYRFTVGSTFYANLDPAELLDQTPEEAFDPGVYQVTYNADGTFGATVTTTTTQNNQTTATETAITFHFVEGAQIEFRPEGSAAFTATYVESRPTKLEEGAYTLNEPIVELRYGELIEILPAGAVVQLKEGVFYDADGYAVRIPRGLSMTSETGAIVNYASTSSTEYVPEADEELTMEDGSVLRYKSGTTVYKTETLGTVITFEDYLKTGARTITLDAERGALMIDRPVTVDASTLGGLTIDAMNNNAVFEIDSYRVDQASGAVSLSSMTLKNGLSTDGGLVKIADMSNVRFDKTTFEQGVSDNGGAIYNAGKLTLGSGTTISNAQAENGGAIYNAATGSITVEGKIGATSAEIGGAIYNLGSVTLSGATIDSVSAVDNGGAVYNAGTLSLVKKTVITNATTDARGGAIYNEGALSVNNATFSDNEAGIYGGAIFNAAGSTSVTNATFANNSAKLGGAVFTQAPFFATRASFGGNVSTSALQGGKAKGDALYVENSKATVINSKFAGNGDFAGELAYAIVSNEYSELVLNFNTIVRNEGGVYAYGTAYVYNNIVGENEIDLDASGAYDVKYNMIEVALNPLDETNLGVYAPNFQDISGDDWTKWNLRLAEGSLAIDAAGMDYAYYNDLNGRLREIKSDFADAIRPNGAASDLGAYEIDASKETASTVVTTLLDVEDPRDGLISLREAVKYAASGNSEATRTVTFSPDLFDSDPEGRWTIQLTSGEAGDEMGTIFIDGYVVVTTAYEAQDGTTKYRDIVVDGQGNAPLFVKRGTGEAELRGLTLTGGSASGDVYKDGGAIVLKQGALNVVDCFIVGNYAERDGGAIYQEGGSLYLVDVLIADNVAGRYGGAIRSENGVAYIYNTTIADNDAALYGGVMSNTGGITMANTIVAQNGGSQNCDVHANNFSATANLIGAMDRWASPNGLNGNRVGTPEAPLDPLFVGFAGTATTRAEYGVKYSLTGASAAVNSGVNAYANGPNGVRLALDLNAEERIVGEVVDMGAFESQYRDVPSTVVTTTEDVVDQTDGVISLREALEHAKTLKTPITFDFGPQASDVKVMIDYGQSAFEIADAVEIDGSSIAGGVEIVGNEESGLFIVKNGGSLNLTNVKLSGGRATRGGAVYMTGGDLNLTNCVVSGNEAEIGGAIYVEATGAKGANVKLLNTTIAGNDAESYPGVYFESPRGVIEIQNTIIAENATPTSTSGDNYDLYVELKSTATVESVVKSTASIVGAAGANLVAAYAGVQGNVYGTNDEEGFVDPGFNASQVGDYSLKTDSIALNRGSNRLVGYAGYYASILTSGSNVRVLNTDFVGNPRIVGGTVDIGAYELQERTETPSVVVTTALDVVDPFDGLISLREAIDYAGSAYTQNGRSVEVGRTITFAPQLAGGVLQLESTLEFGKTVTIDATGLAGGLKLVGGDNFGVLKVNAGDLAGQQTVLAGLAITGGVADTGAGVYHAGGNLMLLNCSIYGNTGASGVGVRSDAGALKLVNCTIAGNVASYAYGGVYSIGGAVTLHNTIVAENTVNGSSAVDFFVANIADMQSSLIGVASIQVATNHNGARGNLVGVPGSAIDPGFVDVAKYDFTLGKTASGSVSPAINAGTNVLTVYPNGVVPSYDASGALRFVGGVVDIGAYESPMGPTEMPSTIVTTVDDVVDAYDGLISLREAVAYANNYNLGSTITFAASINGSTLYLNDSLTLETDLVIDGLANGAQGFVLTTASGVVDRPIVYVNSGSSVLNGLTITGRRSERLQLGEKDFTVENGGAIYVRAGSIALYNCLLTDNAAKKGSVVYLNEASNEVAAKLVNCTVVKNMTLGSIDSGAVYAASGKLTLQNTIFAYNEAENMTGPSATDVYVGGSATVVAQNSYVSYSNTLAPQAAGKNGCYVGSDFFDLSAETANLFVDVENGDYNLTDGSLATNGGNNTYINAGVFDGSYDSTDIAGKRRVYYQTIDMGAYENQRAQDNPVASVTASSITLSVTTASDVVDSTDGKTSLREALQLADRMVDLGYDVTIRMADAYKVKLTESCLQVVCPVTIFGNGSTIDGGNANCAFLVNTDGDVKISNFIITNGAALNGGGVKVEGGNLTLTDSLIYNCDARVAGGAIYSSTSGNVVLGNVTLAKNTASRGAGVYATGSGNLGVYNSIVATNRSNATADAIDVELDGVLQLLPDADTKDRFTGVFSVGSSLVGDVGTVANKAYVVARGADENLIGYGVDNTVDPKFLNASSGNFQLDPVASPANGAGSWSYIDWGNQVPLGGNYTFGHISLGPYQVGQEEVSYVVTTLEDIVDPYDGLISLREAIQYATSNHGYDCLSTGYSGSRVASSNYAGENAMNNSGVYSATYYNPITFDKSLAGGTIVLKAKVEPDPEAGDDDPWHNEPEYGGFTFTQHAGWTYDMTHYIIDATALADLGGITIDATAITDESVFVVRGSGNDTDGATGPVTLDLRGIEIRGASTRRPGHWGRAAAGVSVNNYGVVTMRDCLITGFQTAVTVSDNDSTDGGAAQIYSSTIVGNISNSGCTRIYNSVIVGYVDTRAKTTNPAYRQTHLYSTYSSGGWNGWRTTTYGNTFSGSSLEDMFINGAEGDYRLATFSPAMNAGDNTYRRTLEPIFADGEVDLNGNIRVMNNTIDLGCYENAYVKDTPSTIVTTLEDVVDYTDGKTSIREALAYAEQWTSIYGGTVRFADSLAGGTIYLTEGPIQLTRNVNFDGGGTITLDGCGEHNIFDINISRNNIQTNVANVNINNLTLTNGYTAASGGAISVGAGNVWMSGLNIYGCVAAQYGGAIYAENSEILIVDSRIGANTAAYYGGVVNQYGRTVLRNTYVAENVGTTQNADVWGKYPANFNNSQNSVIGFVKDIDLKDGDRNNKIGTETNPIKCFVDAKKDAD